MGIAIKFPAGGHGRINGFYVCYERWSQYHREGPPLEIPVGNGPERRCVDLSLNRRNGTSLAAPIFRMISIISTTDFHLR